MRARREAAWRVVQRVWAPVQAQGGTVPAWMTWYEQEDIEQLYRDMLTRHPGSIPLVEMPSLISTVMNARPNKDLQTSLSSARMGKVLRQFTFPEFQLLASHVRPGTGTIYYSPSYVKHLLANAESIANYDARSFERTAAGISSPALLGVQNGEASGRLPPSRRLDTPLLVSDPPNRYARSMDREMPADAIMIKVNWIPASEGAVRYLTGGEEIAQGFGQSTTGKWQLGGVALQGRRYKITGSEFVVANDEKGSPWGLMAMHIASKNVRTWTWTTLIWGAHSASHGGWDADMPPALASEWPALQSYGMVTASDFTEGDPAPWTEYMGKGSAMQTLGNSLQAISRAMGNVQWCANPYIETEMSHTNCIGCHQGSPREFLATTLTQKYEVNVGDFSFSIAKNREAFLRVRQELAAKQPSHRIDFRRR